MTMPTMASAVIKIWVMSIPQLWRGALSNTSVQGVGLR